MDITLTDNETKVLMSIKNPTYPGISFFDQGWNVDSETWLDVITEDLVPILGISAQAVGGVLSSMIQKGLFKSDGECIFLTEAALTAI